MSQLRDLIRASVAQADKAYKEASTSLEQINTLYTAIPVEDALHSRDVRDIRVVVVQARDRAMEVLHDLEVLEASMQALESVKGE